MQSVINMLLPFFQLSLAIRNVWPQRMSLKAFIGLYMLLLLAGMPVTLLSCIPYGLFGILAAVCIYGLVICRDTASWNVCMSMIGFVIAIVTESLLSNLLMALHSLIFPEQQYFSVGVSLVLRQAASKIITVSQRYFLSSADLVSDRCRIAAVNYHLFV